MNVVYYQSPVGLLKVGESNNFIVHLSVVTSREGEESQTPLLDEAVKQLSEYFSGERFEFDLPLKQEGTPFQQKAWDYLQKIPYAETVSYKDEAKAIDAEQACRAVGSANGKNDIAIIVPCHRVVSANGKLGGYAYGLDIKKQLLDMEKSFASSKNK